MAESREAVQQMLAKAEEQYTEAIIDGQPRRGSVSRAPYLQVVAMENAKAAERERSARNGESLADDARRFERLNGQVINADIRIDGTRPKSISDKLIGIFFEDINYSADGGLYAELIRNRSFEEKADEPLAWKTFSGSKMALTSEELLNSVQQHALQLAVTQPGGGVENEGFWGIHAQNGMQYTLSFWVRCIEGNPGQFTASLVSKDGTTLGSVSLSDKVGKKWKKLTARFVCTADDPRAQFRLTTERPCQLALDVVSLFPPTFKNRENGMRPDLANMLWQLHPKFMRFPGGCFVEGQESPDNAFRWERTI